MSAADDSSSKAPAAPANAGPVNADPAPATAAEVLAVLRAAAARDAADPALYTLEAVKAGAAEPLDVSALAVAGVQRRFVYYAISRLYGAAPYLKALEPLLGAGRLWVAGGSLARAGYQARRLSPGGLDVDLFGVADETAAISAAIEAWAKDLKNIRVYRYCSEYAMTWVFERASSGTLRYPNLQYIRAPYANLRACLGTFDIAQAQVAFVGTRLLFTAAAARAARLGVSLADAARVSPTWGHRVAKYSRFCAIAFPLPAGAARDFEVGASTFRLAGRTFACLAPADGAAAGAAADGAAVDKATVDKVAVDKATVDKVTIDKVTIDIAAIDGAGDPQSSYDPSSLQYGSRAALATDLYNVARLAALRPARAFVGWLDFGALRAEVAKEDGSGRWAARSALRRLLPSAELADDLAETLAPSQLARVLTREFATARNRARFFKRPIAVGGVYPFAAAPVDHYTPADPAAFFGPEML